ncbi:hypothetical protein JXJ21_02830 [candidate division KSB1 bacterium]|nr:hypothetical protein [candidate division KSB1 bacterium]
MYKEDPRFKTAVGDTLLDFTQGIVSGVDNLEGQYVDEFLMGYDREIAGNLKISVNGTYRVLGQVIQSIVDENNNILFGNPGK